MEMAGNLFSEAELDDAMKELDPSGDGQVDFNEFKTYWEDNIVAGGCVTQPIIANSVTHPPCRAPHPRLKAALTHLSAREPQRAAEGDHGSV